MLKNITLNPSQLMGTVEAPPSKSDTHRAIICAALSKGVCKISPVVFSNDISATINCIKSLGAKVSFDLIKKTLTIDSKNLFDINSATLNCEESGSTLRFLIPIAAAGGVNAKFLGTGKLPKRPIGTYLDILPKFGVECKSKSGLPLEISGKLKSGIFELPGDISSQFITGLLLALPLLNGNSEIFLTSALESSGYVDMTIATMRQFGIKIKKTDNGYSVAGNQAYKAIDYSIEGDWSQAAFWLVGGAVSGNVSVTGLNLHSIQGDKEILNILKSFGVSLTTDEDSVQTEISNIVAPASEIDASEIPDLVPIISVLASVANGKTKIVNAQRLRIKESDRLTAISKALNAIGANVSEFSSGLEITGTDLLKSGTAEGKNDHRIVMSCAIAALVSEGKTTITDAFSIEKSYPNFFEVYEKLGGFIEN